MKFTVCLAICLLSILNGLLVTSERVNFDGYKIYEVTAQNDQQSESLLNISMSNRRVNFLNLVRTPNIPLHVVVPPNDQSTFEQHLAQNSVKIKILVTDLSKLIREEQRPRPDLRASQMTFDRYYSHNEINFYLDTLAQEYPNRVSVQTIGYSYEKRAIKSITITNGVPGNKKVILIDAGIHAREWIAPATALYVIYQLVEHFPENKDLLRNYNWVVIPSTNPDGYEHSMVHNRLWRKTRKPNVDCGPMPGGFRPQFGANGMVFDKCSRQYVNFEGRLPNGAKPDVICGFGADGNRNFGSHWAEVGTSYDHCNDQYHGSHAFSEPETQALRDVLHALAEKTQMYLSLHSYGSYLLYPWGFSRNLPKNWRDIEEVAYAGVDAIRRVSGRQYQVGSLTTTLYPASGGSIDYAMEKLGIPITMCMELPFGGAGFDPSIAEMRKLVVESWLGIRAMGLKVQQKFP